MVGLQELSRALVGSNLGSDDKYLARLRSLLLVSKDLEPVHQIQTVGMEEARIHNFVSPYLPDLPLHQPAPCVRSPERL